MRFNGISPSEISPRVYVARELIDSIPPREPRMVSGTTESYLAGVQLSPRNIKLLLNFAGRSHENANELAEKVAALFCRDDISEYEPSHMPGKAIGVILQSAGQLEWRWGFGTIEYNFLAPRPFFHSTSETVINGDDVIRIYPMGSVPCRPVIRHTMAEAAASLQIMASSRTIMRIRNPLGGNLAAGSSVEIDFSKRLASVNGLIAMEYVDYTASDWHPDIKGATLITVSDSGPTQVRWFDEWM